jgi:AcrR family transcriptional regulator
MAPEYLGRGEARRSMELLWGRSQPARRGPKAALDLETVVRAAIELADAEGLEALSMRRVAERLEVGTMSLYTYVPGKGELLDLMLDTVYAERLDGDDADPRDLRSSLEAVAREQWAFFLRHPWTLSIASGRSVLGPNEAASYDRSLAVVADLDLPAREAVAIVDAISMFVRGAARDRAEAAGAEAATGQSEAEWWTEREALLNEVMTAERFPTLDRLASAGGFDVPPDTENYNVRFIVDDFEFGLQRLLDGIERYVEARAVRPR